MKPCPHCQADNPIVYEDSLYCGNCNAPYPVAKRVYALTDLKDEYLKMRDYANEIMRITQEAYQKANIQPSQEVVELYQRTKDMAEQYDEWGNA